MKAAAVAIAKKGGGLLAMMEVHNIIEQLTQF
jgi:hypothetical protein